MATTTRPATDKQIAFITRLLNDRVASPAFRAGLEGTLDTLSTREASQAIDYLMSQPRVPSNAEALTASGTPVSEPGIYEVDGQIFRVKQAKTSGNLYASILTATDGATRLTEAGTAIAAKYEYAPGAMRKLRAEHRVTAERAEELSLVFTFCLVCSRHLSASASVKRGIGPVCAGKV